MRYVLPIILLTGILFALDYYVYRTWRRYAFLRERLRWTLWVYRVLLFVMPFTLPLYLNLYSWWEVEPRLARALFFAVWALYYLPKVPIVAVLAAKDALRLLKRASERISSRPDASRGETTAGQDMTRSEFLRRLGWSAAAVPFVLTGYGVYRTLYDFSVHRVEVPIVGLPRAFEGLTIAQLSDLHAGSLLSDRPMWDAVSIVGGLRPDLIALTGDYVNHDAEEITRLLPALKAMEADLGIYGCLGNHDHYANTERLIGRIGATPIDLLVNEHRTLEIDGAKLHVVGTDNTGFRQHHGDLPKAVAGIARGGDSAQILLAHDPTFWDLEVRPHYSAVDLMLCGHTHGGQFGIEVGPIRWSLAQMRYERWAGLYEEPRENGRGAQFLYVNRGLGTVGPPLRLGIRPEITLLTLRRAVGRPRMLTYG